MFIPKNIFLVTLDTFLHEYGQIHRSVKNTFLGSFFLLFMRGLSDKCDRERYCTKNL